MAEHSGMAGRAQVVSTLQERHVPVEKSERLLTPGEVAVMFRVDPKTVTRWASAGRISSIRTPGGHRRFRESEVTGLLARSTVEAFQPSD